MKNKHPYQTKLNAAEEQLIQQLREHPELMERFQAILQITSNAQSPIKQADEIEALLIEEMRRLGNSTMVSWASRVEKNPGRTIKAEGSLGGRP